MKERAQVKTMQGGEHIHIDVENKQCYRILGCIRVFLTLNGI